MNIQSERRKRLDCLYGSIGELGDPCVYCGLTSICWDHIPPLHFVDRLSETDRAKFRLRTVPSCRECNSFLGGQILSTIQERRRYVKERIRRKYKSWIEMPEWTIEEVAELSTEDAKAYIASHARFSVVVRRRLNFYEKTVLDVPNANAGHSTGEIIPLPRSDYGGSK
jgi:hypothetical protein